MTGGTPSGYPYPGGAPAQTTRRRIAGPCLIWGLAGCGGLLLLLIIFIVVISRTFGGQFKKLVNGITAVPSYKERLIGIHSALQAYQHDHKGRYPIRLKDLVPKYLPDDSDFSYHIPSSGETIPIEYTPPGKDAPEDAVVAGFFTGSLDFSSLQTQKLYVRLLKNGRIVQDQIVRQDLP